MRAVLASHLLQHRDYPRVSSGRSIPSAQVVGWLLPWQGLLAQVWEAAATQSWWGQRDFWRDWHFSTPLRRHPGAVG